METILALMLLFLVNVSAAPTRKVDCLDEYGHCPEWSKAGYCDRTGYKTYMTLMCAYSCNTCKDVKQRKESGGEDVASASGLDDGQLETPSDIQGTERDEDGGSANEPVSGEGEIHGDSDGYEEKKENHDRVDKLQNEQRNDAVHESEIKAKQSSERHQRQSISEQNEDNQDVTSKRTQDENMATTENGDPPGVHLIKFHENNVDDDVNPRSEISTRPKENNPSANYKPLRETKAQSSKEITENRDEDVSASGSMLDESGEAERDESRTANPKASGESEEMRDIAGDIKTGSKIFEADSNEPEGTSGCSSGFGCFSGNGEQIQSEKSEEAEELEPRSKIAKPKVKNVKSQQAKLDDKTAAHGQTSLERDSDSDSHTAAKDDIQSNSEDQAHESDDIVGTQSAAKSNPKTTTTASPTSEENLEASKSDAEGEKISNEKASSGSGADVNNDIQGQSIHGDNDESIDGGKPATNSDAISGSGADTTHLKSESPKEVQNAPKSDAESKNVNEQDDTQGTTSESEAKGDADSEDVDVQKDDISETKTDESPKSDTENEEMHGQDETKTDTTNSDSNDNQKEAKSDFNKQKDVKTVETNGSQSSGEKEEAEENSETFSGSAAASIDTNKSIDADEDEEPGSDPTKSQTKGKTANMQPSDTEEKDMEDALYEEMLNENKGSNNGSGQAEKDSNEDLSSPAVRQRITSMEQLIKDDKPKAGKAKDVPAKTRVNVPSREETPDDYINTDLGKGQKVKLILDQHYYKPYSNEDSMAYEMLALDLKKEVERAVGNQAIVSQISFSEIQKPGKLPRYSRVLATFMLHGNINTLQGAVRKGEVGDLMVDKKFFQSS